LYIVLVLHLSHFFFDAYWHGGFFRAKLQQTREEFQAQVRCFVPYTLLSTLIVIALIVKSFLKRGDCPSIFLHYFLFDMILTLIKIPHIVLEHHRQTFQVYQILKDSLESLYYVLREQEDENEEKMEEVEKEFDQQKFDMKARFS
jgi:hypothetical protein